MRTEPARFEVRTEWMYSEPDPRIVVPPGRTRHAFYRGGKVVRSDLTLQEHRRAELLSNLSDAVGAFGDDKDLIVEVRLKDTPEEPVHMLVLAGGVFRTACLKALYDEGTTLRVTGTDRLLTCTVCRTELGLEA